MRPAAFLAFLCLGPLSQLVARTNQSTSGSRQFIVVCEDRSLRQTLAGVFDEVRQGLFSELGVQLGPSIPVYVTVSARKIVQYNARTWNMRWLEAPEGARVQLDVLVDDAMQGARLQEHIVGALLLTLKYRDNPPTGGQAYGEAPAWLVEGLSEKIRLRNREPDAVLYRGLLNAKTVPDLAEWLKIDPATLDATTLGIYRAYACGLVQYFLGEPNGPRRVLQLLKTLPTDPAGAIAVMEKAYPAIGGDPRNLAKWWSLSLAKLSAADRYAAWSGADTNSALDKALRLNLTVSGEKKSFTLEEFADFAKVPGRADALALIQNELLRLSVHAHPLYRPVIAGYQEAVLRLQNGKERGLSEKLDQLAELRVQLTQRLQDIGDYLTWFEGSQVTVSGPSEFDSYFRLMESFRAPRPPSREPIGRYLDAMEAELK